MQIKPRTVKVLLISLLLVLGIVAFGHPGTVAAQTTPTAVVATGLLNVRSGPGVEFTVVATTHQGHVVALLGRNSASTWARVRLFSGQEGWVNAAFLQPSVAITSLPVVAATTPATTPVGTAIVSSGALNVRSGPGLGFGVVAITYQGHVVTLLGRNANATWAKIRLVTGQDGWVNASLLQPSVAITSLPVADAPAQPTPAAVVATGALNVRSGPGIEFGVVAVAQQGHSVTMLGRNADASWVRIRLASSQEGWVNASLLQTTVAISSLPVVTAPAPTPPPAPTATAVVATGALNVRSGPGVTFDIIANTFQGHVVALLGRNANATWARVRLFSGQEGWVNAAFLQPSVAITSLPVVATPTPTQPPAPAATARVTSFALNVRSGPGVGFTIVGAAYEGQTVTLIGRNAGATWAKIRLATGHEGWVNVAFLQPSVAISSLPVVG